MGVGNPDGPEPERLDVFRGHRAALASIGGRGVTQPVVPAQVVGAACFDAGDRQEQEEIGGVEVGIPCGLAADPCTEAQAALDQRRRRPGWRTGCRECRQRRPRNDPILRRREIPARELDVDGGRMGATIGHADARATDEVGGASFPGELRGAGPEQHRGCAGPIGRVDAGATHFEELAPEMANPGQVEFPLAQKAPSRRALSEVNRR